MRTALIAGLVAGTAVLHTAPVAAAEGSSLRGLKPPQSALEAYSLIDTGSAAGGLKARSAPARSTLAPRLSRYEGRSESVFYSAGDTDFRIGSHRPAGRTGMSSPFLLDTQPKHTLHSEAVRHLGGGWGLGFGVRQADFQLGTASLLALTAERYWGSLRGAYTVYSHRLDGSSAGSAHRVQLSYAYGERNTVGLSYTTGRDVEALAMPMGLTLADVRDWTLSGRHWLTTNWALTYDVAQEHSALYRRQGLRLGVSRSF